MTSLPTWAIWALSFGSPALTAVIALLAQFFGQRAARDLEARSKREEVMRSLRWAAELAVSEDVRKARLGIQELQALRASKLLTPAEEGFIDAALQAAIEVPRRAIAASSGDVEVVVVTRTDVPQQPPVSSEEVEEEKTDIL